MIDIKYLYKFTSFVEFLDDYILKRKIEDGDSFTLGKLARVLGLTSSAELTNVLKKRRPVSHKMLTSLKAYLRLCPAGIRYIDLIAERDRNENNQVLLALLNEKIFELRGKS